MFSFTSSEISAERRRLYRRVSTASRRWCCCCCPLRNGEPLLDPPSPVESQSRENDSSPSWKLKRLRSSIDNGVHALGVGLGGAMPRITKFARTGSVRFKDVCSSPSDVCMWLGAAVSLPVLVLLNFNRAYAMHETIFKTDINSRTEALIRCACVPVACTAVNYFVQHLRRTVFFWEKRTEDRFFQQSVTRWIDPISIGLMLLAALFLIRNACCIILEDNVAQQVHFCFTGLMVMICAIFYFMLDRINDVLHSMITDQEIINHSKPVEKMQNIVHNISRSGDTERDIVYSFSHTHTVPAKVLHYIWSIYYLIGKILGALVVLAFFAQVESETINRFLLGSLLISGAASGGFMLELGPSTISLLRLSLYKPFYVGDLVTLNKTGDMAMTEAVVGFVENITMMYVVIRNFEMKQVWISHKAFNELVIQNWTRRPTKTVLLNIGISTKAPKAKVQSLQEFGKKWIKGSPDIQQNNYQKCHITSTSNGYNLEIIFFPMVGVSHRQIRQKFLMSFMSAAERLNVPFVPLQLMQNFCEDCELGNVEAMSVAAHAAKEVALDDLLPDPDDLLERGKE